MAVQVDSKVDAIRAQLPAVRAKAYMNTGTNGPLPRVAAEAMAEMARAEFEEGRISMGGWALKGAEKPKAREALARAFNVKPSEIALTQLTTEGMNVMIHGIDWQRGDEAIITNLEHPGGQLPLYVVARRYGVQIKLVDLGVGDGDVAGKIERLITPRTRAVVISHIAWNTGAVLPLKEICDVCRKHGVLSLIDAAQSAGSIDPRLYENDPDAYAMPGQKWMCGPEGTGSLYINESRVGWFQQTYVNYGSAAPGSSDPTGYFTPSAGAARFDRIATYYPLIAGQRAATEWLNDSVGLDWAYERISKLGKLAHKTLGNIDGVDIITPKDRLAGLVSFNLAGMEPNDLVTALDERGFILRTIPDPACVRLSTGFYNTEEEIETLGAAIEDVKKSG
ncbi:MAG TPA: aminotransferase class V-fold PLP-dependent enzyme [Thermomicrobiales bacterium]|nr:aminotransferase class V-fold PLP-dependent enzyme [Thermomicrobiales bacterium]